MTKKEEILSLAFLARTGTKMSTIAAQKGVGPATVIAVAEELRLYLIETEAEVAELRGVELSLEQMREYADAPVTYRVEVLHDEN